MFLISKYGPQFVESFTHRYSTNRDQTHWTKFSHKAQRFATVEEAKAAIKSHNLSSAKVYSAESKPF